MSDKRYAVIHFTDGTKITLDFPKQGEDIDVAKKMQKIMDSPCLMIEADGTLLTIPMTSIKYIQSHPRPPILPDIVISGASIID